MVEIVEVGPRDGLQNEQVLLTLPHKIELVERAVAAGVRRIEVGSFVNPKRVPQMADTDALFEALPRRRDVVYIGLVLNMRGAERALEAGADELGAVCVATDAFAMRNQGQTSEESLDVACAIVERAAAVGRPAQVTIGASFGCPFEGEVSHDRIVEMARRAAAAGAREVAIADTIGVATPRDVTRLTTRVVAAVEPTPVRAHFHNTRNTGLGNVWAAVKAGASTIDASLGGLGGCPFAPGAAGNVATEDVVYLLERSEVPTGLDLDRLIAASAWLSGIMRKPLPGMVAKAGPFPPGSRTDP